jgi:hypothetical protein
MYFFVAIRRFSSLVQNFFFKTELPIQYYRKINIYIASVCKKVDHASSVTYFLSSFCRNPGFLL